MIIGNYNQISLVMIMERVSFPQAVNILAARMHIDIGGTFQGWAQ